jgi:hypothetical protein
VFLLLPFIIITTANPLPLSLFPLFLFFFIIFSRVASKTNCGGDFFVAAHGDGFGGGDFL